MSRNEKAIQDYLKERLTRYESEMSMTKAERKALHQWVADGNDPYSNGCFWYNEDGTEMDYVKAMRMDEAVYDKLDSMTEKELNEFLEYQKRQQQSSDLLTVGELPWN